MAAEKQFENKIKNFLDSSGIWFIKYWAGSQFTKSGVPDILACVNGYFVGIEVKSENGKPSELQLHNIKKINNAGGFAFVLYPSAFYEFKVFIDDLLVDVFDRDKIPIIWKGGEKHGKCKKKNFTRNDVCKHERKTEEVTP